MGLCLAGLAVGAWLGARGDTWTVAAQSLPTPSTSRVELALSVHVSGWVVNPGVVEVADGAIVADAIDAAGGARPGAGLEAINLAAPLAGGDQVHVPGPDELGAPAAGSGGVATDGRIPINRADATELQGLPGVGPVLAERIVAHREENGPFQEVEDLLDVPGIGEAKLAAMRDLVAVP